MNRMITLTLMGLIGLVFAGSTALAAAPKKAHAEKPHTAVFAGGCFWCMQPGFDKTEGVVSTLVGYAGGDAKTANYEAVSSGRTEHLEAIEVTYDPKKVSYERLLTIYLENIDPTQADGQFADRGPQYHTAIFYADEAQKAAAEKALKAIEAKFAPEPIVVKLLPAKPFYAAEDYHQKYYEKNSVHYNAYKRGSGREGFIERTWGKK
jgi:methionine-S-sulfoxide reductase